MKYLIIVLSILLTCSCSNNYNSDEEEYKSYHENGKLQNKIGIKNNKKNGPLFSYYEDGSLATTGFFKDDQRDKKWTYYDKETHKVTAIENYVDGKLEGEQEYYYPSGILKLKGSCVKDERVGFWSQYTSEGKLEVQNIFLGKGEGINVAMYDSKEKIVCSGVVKDGNKEGIWLYFDDDGKKLYEVNYVEGIRDGEWKAYDKNGRLIVSGYYNEGQMLGIE